MKKLILLPFLVYSANCPGQNYLDNLLTGTPVSTTIASSTNSVSQPRDLDFKPGTSELWVANRGNANGGTVVIIYHAGQTGQVAQYRKDSHSGHFMIYPSGIAFGDNGEWANTNEIKNTASASSTFMGPALWTGDTSIFARVFQNNWVNGRPLGSHLDMIHQSPFSMGIAHDTASMYWVFDGHNGNLCKYDFGAHHSPGYDDHSNARIWRYTDVPLTREVDMPGHMIKDKSSGWLYVVDAGTKKLKRVNTNTGATTGTLTVPSTSPEPLAGYWAMTGAQVQVVDSFPTGQPIGVDHYNGRLIVSDYVTGIIHVYNTTGATPVKIGTITAAPGIMGVKIGPDGNIWYVNYTGNTVVRLAPASVSNNDASIERITAPVLNSSEANYYFTGFNQCAATITPTVTLKNAGANLLTNATINYRVDNGPVSTYSWTGSLAANATAPVTLNPISATDGGHKLKVWVSNPNAGTDPNPANDGKEGAFRVRFPVVSYPFSEDFNAGTFPPTGWTYIGHNFHNEMTRTPSVGAFGSSGGSVRMDHFSSAENITGQRDYLMLPGINMASGASNAQLSFDVAYAQYSTATSDRLAVMVSTDCGATWSEVFNKAGTTLSTTAPTVGFFTPTAAQWRSESVSLASYAGQANVTVMFLSTSAHGNNLYLDNVSVASPTGIESIASNQVSVFPNPTTARVSVNLTENTGAVTIRVTDIVGRLATTVTGNNANGKYEVDLSGQANGTYFINVLTGGSSYQQKITLTK